jgi:predicted nucleic acid-binding protein
MLQPTQVKSQVVDIRKTAAPIPRDAAVDANVLYFCNYPSFSQLQSAGGKSPCWYQLSAYPKWWAKALTTKCNFATSIATLGEFIQLVEHAELETCWLTDPSRTGVLFSKKGARYDDAARLTTIRQSALTAVASIEKSVSIFPNRGAQPSDDFRSMNDEWMVSYGDYPDAVLIAQARAGGIKNVVTDDIDFLTFDGLIVHTANDKAVQLALTAGKLL